MKSTCLIVLALFGAFATIKAYPSVKGVPSQVSDVKGLKHPPSPGHYDRPSKVGQSRDDVKGVKSVPVVQQQQQQQVQDEVKGVQQRDQQVKGQFPVPQYPVKGVQRDPVKGISQHPIAQHPIKGQHPISQQPFKGQQPIAQEPVKGQQPLGVTRQPYPVKGYPQQREESAKGAKSLVQQSEVKGVPRQRPYYPVKGHPHQQTQQQQVQDDVQQRQQPVFPVKGQRQTRSLNYEQDFDSGKVSPAHALQQREQSVKGRKGGIKGAPKAPTKGALRKGGKSVEDVKIVQQESKVANVQSPVQTKEQKVDEQVKVEQNSVKSVQESVPVAVSQEKVVQESVPVVKVAQEKVAQESVPVAKDVQEKVVQESVKVAQEAVPVQVKDTQVKSEEVQSRSEEAVKGQTVVYAVANGVGAGSGGSASASASAVVVVSQEPQVKEDVKSVIVDDKKDDVKVVKSDETKQARNMGKVGSPVKGVPFYRRKISQQKDVTVQQNDQQVVQEPQVVQQDQTVQQD